MIETKYIPLIQKPDCCSVACLQMILFRNGYTIYSQDETAKELGLFIDKKNANAFSVKLKLRSKNAEINKTIENTSKINAFFKKNKICLEAKSYKISEIKNPARFIKDSLDKDYDLQIEFANKPIYGTDGGHDCLISDLKKKGEKYFATLIDPYWNHRQIYEVPFDRLIFAMQRNVEFQPMRERGIIVVKKKDS